MWCTPPFFYSFCLDTSTRYAILFLNYFSFPCYSSLACSKVAIEYVEWFEGANISQLLNLDSFWLFQSVEKAAMVFSLKLDSGHKFLCPWTNNICTEELAQFPILSPAALIEDYKKHLFSLSHLSALPVVLPASITSLRSSQLEQFLRESSDSWCNIPNEQSRPEVPEDVPESISFISYYQVWQKRLRSANILWSCVDIF